MPLESGNYITDLVPSNPVGAVDDVSEGYAHLQLIKTCVKQSLPNVSGPVEADQVALSSLRGASGYADDFLFIPGTIIAGGLSSLGVVRDQYGPVRGWRTFETISSLNGQSSVQFPGIDWDIVDHAKICLEELSFTNNDADITFNSSAFSDFQGYLSGRNPFNGENFRFRYWPSDQGFFTFEAADNPDKSTGVFTITRSSNDTMIGDGKFVGLGNPDFGAIYESTGQWTQSGSGGLTVGTTSGTFQSGRITLHLYY